MVKWLAFMNILTGGAEGKDCWFGGVSSSMGCTLLVVATCSSLAKGLVGVRIHGRSTHSRLLFTGLKRWYAAAGIGHPIFPIPGMGEEWLWGKAGYPLFRVTRTPQGLVWRRSSSTGPSTNIYKRVILDSDR
jgi:hypothetical protein